MVAHPLYLAATRPAMIRGVPAEGMAMNVGVVFVGGMFLGSPFWWLVGIPVHLGMKALANKNPNFFRELRMWFITKGANAGGVLWALPHRRQRRKGVPSAI